VETGVTEMNQESPVRFQMVRRVNSCSAEI
jgi:hypothetical protein